MSAAPGEFDVPALFSALDTRRRDEGLSWAGVATAIWELSADLNAQRGDHPISASTLTGMPARRDTSCQHALFMLRWLERAPEDFVPDAHPATLGVALPAAGPDQRLRWRLRALYGALEAAKVRHGATWVQVAARLDCTPAQLTGLRTAKFATGLRLAMRICQHLQRPAATFVHAAQW